MRYFHVVGAVSIFLAVTTAATAGDKSAKAKNKHPIQGIVAEVRRDQDKDTGTLMVTVQPQKKNKGAVPSNTPQTDKKFQITAQTKFEKVVRVSKTEFKHEAASLKDVQKGDPVIIAAIGTDGAEAKTVEIVIKKKAKAKGAGVP